MDKYSVKKEEVVINSSNEKTIQIHSSISDSSVEQVDEISLFSDINKKWSNQMIS